ncbi:hypothetical protein IJU97_02595 [bacterium]|nr:hypothetical protein [bacterium]
MWNELDEEAQKNKKMMEILKVKMLLMKKKRNEFFEKLGIGQKSNGEMFEMVINGEMNLR